MKVGVLKLAMVVELEREKQNTAHLYWMGCKILKKKLASESVLLQSIT